MFTILDAQPLAPNVMRLKVEAPLVARKRQAGQFVIVRVTETGERIPLTICDASRREGTITLVVLAVGKTTRLLCQLRPGDRIQDVVGPLGRPTPMERFGSVACVGGGVGTAELYPIATALRAMGNKVHSIIGARSKSLVILEREMRSCSDALVITTDDGSYGEPGLVTGSLRALLDGPFAIQAVYAIGPLAMMKEISKLTMPYGTRTWVSLNTIMMDGTGMCGGCRVSIGGEMKFACVDGPEFDGHQVDFDELMRRNNAYRDLEQLAVGQDGLGHRACNAGG